MVDFFERYAAGAHQGPRVVTEQQQAVDPGEQKVLLSSFPSA